MMSDQKQSVAVGAVEHMVELLVEQEHLVELLVELVVVVLMNTLVLDHTYVVLPYASSYCIL